MDKFSHVRLQMFPSGVPFASWFAVGPLLVLSLALLFVLFLDRGVVFVHVFTPRQSLANFAANE